MKNLQFKFKTNNPLSKSDFLKVEFPFSLHYMVTASPYTKLDLKLKIPLNLQINWFTLDENTGEK